MKVTQLFDLLFDLEWYNVDRQDICRLCFKSCKGNFFRCDGLSIFLWSKSYTRLDKSWSYSLPMERNSGPFMLSPSLDDDIRQFNFVVCIVTLD